MAGDLKDYFNNMADVIAARGVQAGDSSENIDIGTNREVICQEFFSRHLPKRYGLYLVVCHYRRDG